MPSKLIPFSEVAKHKTPQDLWCIINGKVYDLTEFAADHPGGASIIHDVAGTDATEEFKGPHGENYNIITMTMGEVGEEKAFKGMVDPATLPAPGTVAKKPKKPHAEMDYSSIPPLQAVLNVHDFEHISKRVLYAKGKKQAYDYYSSGADDELTYQENVNAFQRIWLKPRVLVDVKEVEYRRRIMGQLSSFPVYLSAVAMCGLGHEDGELAWMRAAAQEDITFMIPNLSSKSFQSILDARAPNQPTWLQIYVNPSKKVVEDQIRQCEANGVQALAITVDSAVPGKRERDRRNKIAIELGAVKLESQSAKGTKARKAGQYANRDPGLSWDDIKWFQSKTEIPLIIKGCQCAEDVVQAARMGCKAVVLSNHGGRNLDTSRSGIEILPEVVEALKEERLFGQIEIYVDGGVRRGTDILKAIALGATAVGLGKPAVYSMSAYGSEGIARMIQILKDELKMCMQLMGVPSLDRLSPRMLNIKNLDNHSVAAPKAENPWRDTSQAKKSAVTSAPKTVPEIKAEIAKLQAQLKAAGGKVAPEKPGLGAVFGVTVKAVGTSIAKTIFTPSANVALHRSAVFLILYLVVHLTGNLGVFVFDADGWNKSIDSFAHTLPYKLFEGYLGISFVLHAAIGLWNSLKKKNFIMSAPAKNGRLAVTGILMTAFVFVHVTSLRFGPTEGYMTEGDHSIRDYHKQATHHLASPAMLALYLLGIASVGIHLWVGWGKTVFKFNLTNDMRTAVTALGNICIVPLCLGFAAVALYFHLQSDHSSAAAAVHSDL